MSVERGSNWRLTRWKEIRARKFSKWKMSERERGEERNKLVNYSNFLTSFCGLCKSSLVVSHPPPLSSARAVNWRVIQKREYEWLSVKLSIKIFRAGDDFSFLDHPIEHVFRSLSSFIEFLTLFLLNNFIRTQKSNFQPTLETFTFSRSPLIAMEPWIIIEGRSMTLFCYFRSTAILPHFILYS